MKNAGRPQAGEYGSSFQEYIDLAPEEDVVAALEAQSEETAALLGGLSEEQASQRYAPDKWSIKQIVGHVTDGERIFAYRALSIARGETTPLPGFDQDPYVANSGADDRSISDLAAELDAHLGFRQLARRLLFFLKLQLVEAHHPLARRGSSRSSDTDT